jgi:hypothetical protein
MMRRKINKRKSKRMFTKHATRQHKKNRVSANPMRGGTRL